MSNNPYLHVTDTHPSSYSREGSPIGYSQSYEERIRDSAERIRLQDMRRRLQQMKRTPLIHGCAGSTFGDYYDDSSVDNSRHYTAYMDSAQNESDVQPHLQSTHHNNTTGHPSTSHQGHDAIPSPNFSSKHYNRRATRYFVNSSNNTVNINGRAMPVISNRASSAGTRKYPGRDRVGRSETSYGNELDRTDAAEAHRNYQNSTATPRTEVPAHSFAIYGGSWHYNNHPNGRSTIFHKDGVYHHTEDYSQDNLNEENNPWDHSMETSQGNNNYWEYTASHDLSPQNCHSTNATETGRYYQQDMTLSDYPEDTPDLRADSPPPSYDSDLVWPGRD